MRAQHAAVPLHQSLEIRSGLRGVDRAEGAISSRDMQIDGVFAGNLQENPCIRAALVNLPRRVQEARTEFDTRGDPPAIANALTDLLEHPVVCRIHLYVCEKREIIPFIKPIEMRFEIPCQRMRAVRQMRKCSRVLFVCEQFDPVSREESVSPQAAPRFFHTRR